MKHEEECVLPSVMIFSHYVQGVKNNYIHRGLLDSGSTYTLVNRRTISKDMKTTRRNQVVVNTTISGEYEIKDQVIMTEVIIPEFSKSIKIKEIEALVFDSNNQSPYDIILGRCLTRAEALKYLIDQKR
jgi:hypothetical protein